jgi:predicted transcriptional regulator
MDPMYADYLDSNLKALCGQRLVRDPTDTNKDLRTLERRQAIKAIDEGLALIATGRFVLSSR